MYRIITDTPIADTLGFGVLGMSAVMTTVEKFTGFTFNGVIHTLASIGGFVFVCWKLYSLILKTQLQKIDKKIKKEELKQLKKKK